MTLDVQGNKPPKVLVLMATYNGDAFVRRQLDSILDQDGVEVAIMASDDGSSDQTKSILQTYADADSRVEIFQQAQNSGSAAGNFLTLSRYADLSGFNFVAFADQDDEWMPDKLKAACSDIAAYEVAGFSSDVIAYWPDTGKKRYVKKSYAPTGIDHWFESPGPGCTHVFTASSFIEFQAFLSEIEQHISAVAYHDWLVYAFYQYNDLGWHISDEPKMYYVQHANNEIGANFGIGAFRKRLRLLRSRWFRGQVVLLADLISGGRINPLEKNILLRKAFKLRRRRVLSVMLSTSLLSKII